MTKEEQDKEEPIKEINIITYQQSHKDATVPSQGTPGSAGYDLTPCESGVIKPHQQAIINTRIHIAIPRNYFGQIQTRSSAAKLGLSIEGGVINSDYTRPIKLIVCNHSNSTLSFKAQGKAIVQLIIIPYHMDQLQQVD